MPDVRVSTVNLDESEKSLAQARDDLREEIHLLQDLLALKSQTVVALSPGQAQDLSEAVRAGLEVVTIRANRYARCANEFRVSAGRTKSAI